MTEQATTPEMPQRKLLALMAVQTVVLTGLGGLIWYASGREIADFVRFGSVDLALGVALGTGLSAVAASAFTICPRVRDELVRYQGERMPFLNPKLTMSGIALISLGAGIGEEALFRGGIQVLLTDHLGPGPAIALSSAIFALVHMAKPQVAALIFVIGAAFGSIYWYTGSLVAVMLGHALYDIFALWYLQRRLHQLDFFSEAKIGAATE